MRGLKILRSDASKRSVVLAGNQLTHYNFKLAKIDYQYTNQRLGVQSKALDGLSDLAVVADLTGSGECLPAGSPFATVKEALKFAGPMPFTFDYEKQTGSIIRVQGVRQNWYPQPVSVEVSKAEFFKNAPFSAVPPRLASAFYVKDIPYYWKPGIVERIKQSPQDWGGDYDDE